MTRRSFLASLLGAAAIGAPGLPVPSTVLAEANEVIE
jgi:hypothetical protein